MDKAPLYYTANLAGLNNLGNVQSNDHEVPVFGLDVPGPSNPLSGSKRKWDDVDEPSGFLGLSLSSGKDMDDESSIDLSLSIDFPGSQKTSNLNQTTYGHGKALEFKRPDIDLELSLSTAATESDITSVTQGSSHSLPDLEGSLSSQWKRGLGTFTLVNPVNSQNDPIRAATGVSLAAVEAPKGAVSGSPPTVKQQRRASVKICRFEGCTRGARGASGLCIAHGGGRRCQRAGCQKGAEGRTVFCKAHGGGRRCHFLGCTKSAEGRTDFCIGHGGGRRCNNEGCTRAARGKSGLCIRHGGGKRCKMENCTKSAEGVSSLCISHGGGRRCQYPACTKGAQGSTKFCKAHGGGKRCTYLGCTKGAEGSTSFCKGHGGGKRCTFEGCSKSVHGGTSFCVSHGGGKRCSMADCTRSARGRTNYCVRHGGGKRCKFAECTKSAQGSTDFCKAHGGGKRCCWGLVGSDFGGQAVAVCDKFARGKAGLCAAHSAQMQEKMISGGGVSTPELQNPLSGLVNGSVMCSGEQSSVEKRPQELSLPEGRVHGGSLMAMLRGHALFRVCETWDLSLYTVLDLAS